MMPIPPKSWGAVEGTIWLRKICLEQLGHTVHVYNTPMIHEVIAHINAQAYDFVHCHSELFAWACNRYLERPWAVTSHDGRWHAVWSDGELRPEFRCLFEQTLEAPANLVLSDRIASVYARHGYTGWLRVLPNAVEVEQFRLGDAGNGRAICLGAIGPRKRQAWLAATMQGRMSVDFVGPWDRAREPRFRDNATCRYLGVWDRATLHEHLTDYGALVLLSHSEAAPKVVLEALAAGLSVVTNTAGSANLPPQPFITVLPDDEQRPPVIAEAIAAALERNRSLRPAIRDYAQQHLSHAVRTAAYVALIEQCREHFAALTIASRKPVGRDVEIVDH
jgi:glycosyltransferase involved in cell wall biosynthesis